MVASTAQFTVQNAVTSNGVVAQSQLVTLIAYAPPSTSQVRSSNIVAQVNTLGQGVTAVSQLAVLAAYRVGSIENLKNRAWSFSLDGHTFYVMTLGEQGTFVYDEITDEWCQWQTDGLPGWNMEIGTTWKGKVIAADQAEPIIYELDPNSFLDDGFKTQTRKVTGGLAVRQRTFIANYAFRITASLGEPDVGATLPVTPPTINLSFSDDQGKTFVNAGDVTIIDGDNVQELAWLSLGQINAPGRVFQITDTGAIARLDGADAEVGEEGE